MIKKSILHLMITCCCLMQFSYTHAQEKLSLQQAIDYALKNSISIQVSKNYTRIANVNNNIGVAGGLPVVNIAATDEQQSVSINQEYSNPANNSQSNNVGSNTLTAGPEATILLTNGQKVVTEKKRLETVERQTYKQLNSRMQTVVVNVMLRYYDIVRQQSYAKALKTAVDASTEKLEIVKNQQNVGLANNADLFQAQVDLNTAVQLLQAQQLVIDQDKTDLLYQLTLNPDSTINIDDTIIIDKNIQLDSILNNIPAHPDVAAARDQVLINQFLVKETAAQRYPWVSFSGGYTYSRVHNASGFNLLSLQEGPYAGLNINIPIYNGGIYKRQQQIAGINVANAKLMQDTLLNNYTAQAIKNWQAYQSNLQQLEPAQQNYVLSQKLLSLVLQRFQYRQATIVDVKNAQQSFEDAANLLVNISYAGKAAEIQLKRYASMITY